MSSFAERLNQAMYKKTCKAVDVTKATGVIASVISRYRSGQHQPTIRNVFAIAEYLEVSPEWLLNGSDAPEWTKPSQGTLWDKEKIIGVQEELIKNLQKQNMSQSHYINALFKELEEAKIKAKRKRKK